MSMQTMLSYLTALEANNERPWFHAHKEEKLAALASFETLVTFLIPGVQEFDSSIPNLWAKDLFFRLARDTRFGHDKTPYLPALRAHIGPRGKAPIPVGYFIHLQPGDRSFLGAGLYADCYKDATAMMRDALVARGAVWQKILDAPAFAKRFRVQGTQLKKVPQGYDPLHPQAEYIRNKSWFIGYPLSDQMLRDDRFEENVLEVMKAMQPFNAFMNEALRGFVMPTRER